MRFLCLGVSHAEACACRGSSLLLLLIERRHLFSLTDREQTVKMGWFFFFLLGWQMFWHHQLRAVPILLLQPRRVLGLQEWFQEDPKAMCKKPQNSSRTDLCLSCDIPEEIREMLLPCRCLRLCFLSCCYYQNNNFNYFLNANSH